MLDRPSKVEKKEISSEEIKKVRRIFNRLLDSEDGGYFLKYLRTLCGPDVSTIQYGSSGIDTHATMVHEGMRRVWLDLQGHLSNETLKRIK